MPLKINYGKIHKYLGMTFNYTRKGEVKVKIYAYIDGMLGNAPDFWKERIGMEISPPNNLYEIHQTDHPELELLPDDEKSKYQTMKAQGLYLSKRGRPDFQTSFTFHCIIEW